MAMKVDHESHLPIPRDLNQILLDEDGLVSLLSFAAVPSSVQVDTTEVCSVVADHYAIGIQHREDVELVVLSEEAGLFLIGNDEV